MINFTIFRTAVQEKEKYLADLNKAIENARAKGLADDSITIVKGKTTQISDDEQEQYIRHLEAQVQEYHGR